MTTMTFRLAAAAALVALGACEPPAPAPGAAPGAAPQPAPQSAPAPPAAPPPPVAPEEIRAAPTFPHAPAGEVYAGDKNTIRFRYEMADDLVADPDLAFPIERGPAFANTQYFGYGGEGRGEGAENDARNFDYPWRDTFCEMRGSTGDANDACADDKGHPGVDIRPATCARETYWVVAAKDFEPVYTAKAHYAVFYDRAAHRTYAYMHFDPREPNVASGGPPILKGTRLGKVSNRTRSPCPGGTEPNCTTTHLHFEVREGTILKAGGAVGRLSDINALPYYTSLVKAYRTLLVLHPQDLAPAAQPTGPGACRRKP